MLSGCSCSKDVEMQHISNSNLSRDHIADGGKVAARQLFPTVKAETELKDSAASREYRSKFQVDNQVDNLIFPRP